MDRWNEVLQAAWPADGTEEWVELTEAEAALLRKWGLKVERGEDARDVYCFRNIISQYDGLPLQVLRRLEEIRRRHRHRHHRQQKQEQKHRSRNEVEEDRSPRKTTVMPRSNRFRHASLEIAVGAEPAEITPPIVKKHIEIGTAMSPSVEKRLDVEILEDVELGSPEEKGDGSMRSRLLAAARKHPLAAEKGRTLGGAANVTPHFAFNFQEAFSKNQEPLSKRLGAKDTKQQDVFSDEDDEPRSTKDSTTLASTPKSRHTRHSESKRTQRKERQINRDDRVQPETSPVVRKKKTVEMKKTIDKTIVVDDAPSKPRTEELELHASTLTIHQSSVHGNSLDDAAETSTEKTYNQSDEDWSDNSKTSEGNARILAMQSPSSGRADSHETTPFHPTSFTTPDTRKESMQSPSRSVESGSDDATQSAGKTTKVSGCKRLSSSPDASMSSRTPLATKHRRKNVLQKFETPDQPADYSTPKTRTEPNLKHRHKHTHPMRSLDEIRARYQYEYSSDSEEWSDLEYVDRDNSCACCDLPLVAPVVDMLRRTTAQVKNAWEDLR